MMMMMIKITCASN